MSVPAARIRTSSGWRDIAIQGAPGIPGFTPCVRAWGGFTYSAPDAAHRIYTPTLAAKEDGGLSGFPASGQPLAFTVPASGKYLVLTKVCQIANAGVIHVSPIISDATPGNGVAANVSGKADGSETGGVECLCLLTLTAGQTIKLFSCHSGGGAATLVYEIVRIDAPGVSLPSNAPPYVTPAQFAALTPVDGLEVYLIVDATFGQIWHLRYNANSSSAYKWEFLGGGPMLHEIDVDDAITSTTYTDAPNVGPQITLPRAGDYMARFGCAAYNTGASGDMNATLKRGAAASADADSVQVTNLGAFKLISVARDRRLVNMAAGDVVKMQYKTTAGTGQFRWRFLGITPVRIS